MYISIRRWGKLPDFPQPVYKGALNLWEAYLYPPIGNATRNAGYRAPDRQTDVTFIQQTAPSQAWLSYVSTPPPTVAQTWPAVLQGMGISYRVWGGPELDVRTVVEPSFAWVQKVVDREVATWVRAFVPPSYRAFEYVRDVRRMQTVPSDAWQFTIPTNMIFSFYLKVELLPDP